MEIGLGIKTYSDSHSSTTSHTAENMVSSHMAPRKASHTVSEGSETGTSLRHTVHRARYKACCISNDCSGLRKAYCMAGIQSRHGRSSSSRGGKSSNSGHISTGRSHGSLALSLHTLVYYIGNKRCCMCGRRRDDDRKRRCIDS